MGDYLGEFEQLILLALARLGDDAYGVTIRATLIERTKRKPSFGAIYSTLRRISRSTRGGPANGRGGLSLSSKSHMKHPLAFLLRVGRSDDERISLLGDLEEECRARLARGSSRLAVFAW